MKGVTRPGQVKRIAGEGMPVMDRPTHGDLIVKFTVAFPTNISAEQAVALRELFKEAAWHGHDEL
jgi:DnaJ-class molecular chaperone